MNIKRMLFIALLGLIIMIPLAQSNQNQTFFDNELNQAAVKVAVSIVPQIEWIEEIGGEYVDVLSLIPEGQSPHTFEPTTTELIFMENADVWFSIGLLAFDKAKKDAILDAVQNPNFEFVNLSIGLDLIESIGHEHEDSFTIEEEEGNIDPHTWLSPTRTITMIETIRDKLQQIDPIHDSEYDANAID